MEEVAVMVMAAVAAKMIAKLNRLFGLPGIARRRAYVLAMLFFYMSPCHSTTGGRIATQIVALRLSIEKILRLKI